MAKKRIKEINKFMKEFVLELGKVPTSDEMDAEGVGEYLPDDISLLDNGKSKENIDPIKKEIGTIEIESKEKPVDLSGFNNDGIKDIDEEITTTGSVDESGNLYEDHFEEESDDSINKKLDDGNKHTDDEGNKDVRKTTTVKTSNVRLFLVDRKLRRYRIIFTTEDSFKEGYIQVYIASEDGRSKAKLKQGSIEKIEKRAVKKNDNKGFFNKLVTKSSSETMENVVQKDLPIEDNKILLKDIIAKQKNKLSFILDYDEACSLEVKFYGYQK